MFKVRQHNNEHEEEEKKEKRNDKNLRNQMSLRWFLKAALKLWTDFIA